MFELDTIKARNAGTATIHPITARPLGPWPEYPLLQKVVQSARWGRIELLDVTETADGFLVGQAIFGEGKAAHQHSIFLGYAADYTMKKRVTS